MEIFITAFLSAIPNIVTAVVGVVAALITFFAIVPGEQPEKFLQSVVDWIEKHSNK